MLALILAGGSGTRLWPLSRKNNPKQHHAILGDRTLLQETYKRTREKFSDEAIFISANIQQREKKSATTPRYTRGTVAFRANKKNTATAIGYAAYVLAKKNSREILVTLNADQYIKDNQKFFAALDAAARAVTQYPDHAVLLGVNPTYPETGYGYIEVESEKNVL